MYILKEFFLCFQGLDIGEQTIGKFVEVVKRAKTIVWNGYVHSLIIVSFASNLYTTKNFE